MNCFNNIKGDRSLSLQPHVIVGWVALTVAVALTVLACVMASGCYGGGHIYIAAAGILVSSVIPYILAAHLLSKALDVS